MAYQPSARLFVGNLDKTTSATVIGKLFETLGNVKNATITVENSISKGYGYVEMENAEIAEQVRAKFNGHELDGRKIRVEFARPPRPEGEERPRLRGRRFRRGFRGGFGGFRGGYGGYGYPPYPPMYGGYPPMFPRMPRGFSRGFGGFGFPRRRPRRQFDASAPLSSTRVHIGNLPFSATKDDIKAAFGSFKVKEVILPAKRFKPELNVGYGFVEFTSQAEQKKVLEECPMVKLSDRECKIHAAIDKPEQPPKA